MLILLELVQVLGAVLLSIVTLFFMCFAISNEFRETVNDWVDCINKHNQGETIMTTQNRLPLINILGKSHLADDFVNQIKEAQQALRELYTTKGSEQVSTTQINHPDYYNANGYEAIEYIAAHGLNFNLGNVIKYVTRAGKKPHEDTLTALKKAKEYLDHEILRLSKTPDADLLVAPEITQ